MFCSRCNRYVLQDDLIDHVLEHVMTDPTVASLAEQITGYVSQVQALQADNDLSPITDAVTALGNALNPVAPVDPTPVVDPAPSVSD